MKSRPLVPVSIVLASALAWLYFEGSSAEPIVDIVVAVLGGWFLLRGFLLGRGTARPSSLGGRTPRGTTLMGFGLLLLGLVRWIESMAEMAWAPVLLVALFTMAIGAMMEGRAAVGAKADPGGDTAGADPGGDTA